MSKVKDVHIDKLLCFMNDEIEEKGGTPGIVRFDFNHGQEHFLAFGGNTELNDEEIDKLLKTCYSRGYITYPYMGGGEVYSLTTEGHGRAISCETAKHTKEPQQSTTNIFGPIYGQTQIGDYNTQNIEGVFKYIVTEIEQSKAPEEEKRKAKGLLQKAFEHPITRHIIGAGASAFMANLSGGNS